MASNLIPTVRADKNGKLVTRHVKATGDKKPALFTPPSLAARPSHEEMVNEILGRLDVRPPQAEKIKPENVLPFYRLIKNHDMRHGIDRLHNCSLFMAPKMFLTNVGYLERNIDAFNLMIEPYPDYYDLTVSLITGLHNYDFPISREREEALLKVVCAMWVDDVLNDSDFVDELFPSSQSLKRKQRGIGDVCLRDNIAELIVNNPGKESAIQELVLRRKIVDTETLQRLIDGSDSNSLINGVL